jgi:hypothetical protein
MDWHAKQTIIVAIAQALFSSESAGQRGTLAQLRNIAGYSKVTEKAYGNLNSWEPFLKTVTHAHVVSAAIDYFGFTLPVKKKEKMQGAGGAEEEKKEDEREKTKTDQAKADGKPDEGLRVTGKPTRNWAKPPPGTNPQEWYTLQLTKFMRSYVRPGDLRQPGARHENRVKGRLDSENDEDMDDDHDLAKGCDGKIFARRQKAAELDKAVTGVRNYQSNVMWYGLFLEVWNDAVHQGDGDRVIRNWKVALLIFRTWGRHKYAHEAFLQQADMLGMESERVAEMMKWSRFWNGKGKRGCCISLDLHIEHLNKIVKEEIRHLGANFMENGSDGKQIRTGLVQLAHRLTNVAKRYDEVHSVKPKTGHHTDSKHSTRVEAMVRELVDGAVWNPKAGSHHNSFRNMQPSPFHALDSDDMNRWMTSKIHKLSNIQFLDRYRRGEVNNPSSM